MTIHLTISLIFGNMLIDRYFYGVIPMAYQLNEAWGY